MVLARRWQVMILNKNFNLIDSCVLEDAEQVQAFVQAYENASTRASLKIRVFVYELVQSTQEDKR